MISPNTHYEQSKNAGRKKALLPVGEFFQKLDSTMYYGKLVKKSNHLQCRTDKTHCKILCPKCKHNTGFSKLFKSTENVWRHLHQVHQLDKNEFPSTDHVIQVLEKISLAIEKGDQLENIPDVTRLGMIVK